MREGGRERGRERSSEGVREGGREGEGVREGEGEKEEGREGGRENEGGREEGRERGGREGEGGRENEGGRESEGGRERVEVTVTLTVMYIHNIVQSLESSYRQEDSTHVLKLKGRHVTNECSIVSIVFPDLVHPTRPIDCLQSCKIHCFSTAITSTNNFSRTHTHQCTVRNGVIELLRYYCCTVTHTVIIVTASLACSN